MFLTLIKIIGDDTNQWATSLSISGLRAANPVKQKIGRFCDTKKGRNSKHFQNNRTHTNKDFLTILALLLANATIKSEKNVQKTIISRRRLDD